MVAVETKKGVELRVIDPSLFSAPVPVKTWTDKMLPNKALQDKVELYMTDRFVMNPLRGESLKSIQEDPSRGRWHVAETVMAELELESRRQELDEAGQLNEFIRKKKQESQEVER